MKAKKALPVKASSAPKRPARKTVGGPLQRAAHRSERSDSGDAFIPDPGEGPARTSDDLAEILAEDFLESATRGNEVLEDDLDRSLPDEVGGPFVLTDDRDELADGVDESNPEDADVEPLPRANAGLIQRPPEEMLAEGDGDEDDDDDDADGGGGDAEELVDETFPRRRR